MDPRKLEHFLAVIEHGQFNLAATANGVSQQAISKAIAKLEDELGVTLFERGPMGATPTSYAKALERRAQLILAETRLATAELNALSGAKLGTLNLGIGLTVARRIMPRAITIFRQQRPGIGITATVETSGVLYAKLLRGELDIVVSAPPLTHDIDQEIRTLPLFPEVDRPIVRAKHPLAATVKNRTITMADVANYPWLTPRLNISVWFHICRAFADAKLAPPTDVLRTDSLPLVLGLMENEDCICMLGSELIAEELQSGKLVMLDVPGLAIEHPATIAFRRTTTLSAPAKAIIPIIREVCAEYYAAAA